MHAHTLSRHGISEEDSCCVLTALPYGQNEEEVARRTKALSEGMVNYLRRKRAVGISVAPGEEYVVKVCIPSEMTASFLARIAPDWYHTICDKVHLLIVVVKLNTKK
ncbi:Msx2-interacting protein, partial [Stegodyphus mimosarum]